MPRTRPPFLAAAVFLLVFPFFLRRRPRVERRITILAPTDEIFPMLNDLRTWPLWTAWGSQDEVEFSYGELTAGAGAVQRWRSRKMEGVVRIIRSDAGRRLDYEVEMCAGKYQLLGRFDLVPDGACTRVTWRCVWEPALNPYRRYFDLFCKWMIGRDFSSGLANLKIAVERRHAPRTAHA